jgi:hypothetical protein
MHSGPRGQSAQSASAQQAVRHSPFTHSSPLAQSVSSRHSEMTRRSGLQVPRSQKSAERAQSRSPRQPGWQVALMQTKPLAAQSPLKRHSLGGEGLRRQKPFWQVSPVPQSTSRPHG